MGCAHLFRVICLRDRSLDPAGRGSTFQGDVRVNADPIERAVEQFRE
jgi:hypothetical protein